MDEPNEGIQPNIVQLIRDVLLKLGKEQGLTIVLVEQKLPFARAVGETFALMEKGQVIATGDMPDLNDELVSKYLMYSLCIEMDDMKQEFAYEKLSGASSSVNKASAFKGLKNKWLASLFLEFAIKARLSS